MIPSRRITNLLVVLVCVGLLAGAVYMEKVMRLNPCPLCITQRIFYLATALTALIAFFHHPKGFGRIIYALLGLAFAVAGGYFAEHQLWLQSLPPDKVPACGPGLTYMFEVFPFKEAFAMLLKGDGTCAHVDKILGFSIAGWSLVAFVGLTLTHLYQLFRSAK